MMNEVSFLGFKLEPIKLASLRQDVLQNVSGYLLLKGEDDDD